MTRGGGGRPRRPVVGYAGVHNRLVSWRGHPSTMQCVGCGQTARHWAYTGDDPSELQCPRRKVPYSLDPDRYEPKCISCHRRGDAARRRAARPPQPPKPPTKRELTRALLSESVVAELRVMHAVARHVNGATPADHPSRAVSVQFTAMLAELVEAGAIMSYIDVALGVATGSVAARLHRHSYRAPYRSQRFTYAGRPAAHIRKASAA